MTFEDAYREHRTGVARYLRPRCDHPLEIDDVLQETFAQAWVSWGKRQTDNVRAWLIGIARRVCSHMRRGEIIRPLAHSEEWSAEEDTRVYPANQELVVMVAQLREKFSGMGPSQAEVLRGIADGETAGEIATRTGKTAANVRMALAAGRLRLRQQMAA